MASFRAACAAVLLLLIHEASLARILLWDHSARMTTSENVRSVDWLTYSEGSTVTVPFTEWPYDRMLKENTTSLFIHLTFVVRDTSTTMVSVASDDEGEVEACLVDGLLPPLHMPPYGGAKTSGFRVALRNRGTWSSVAIEVPGASTVFVETIIIPYAETDVDIQVDFQRNEISAHVNTRNRKSGGMTVTKTNPTPIPRLDTWPELLTIGTDRHSSKRFTPGTDWEVYSTSLKVGSYSDPPITEREQSLRGRGVLLYRMNDPPIRAAKTVRAKIFEGTLDTPGPSFLRLSFSFTLTNNWRQWFDSSTKTIADLDAPSILCMAKPTAKDSRVNLNYPVGVRVWIKPDLATNDSYVNVELGDGAQLSHRVQVNWPAVQPGLKYNGEIMVFFLGNGDADGSRLPLFRFTSSPEDLFSPNVYVEVPKVAATRNHPNLNAWITGTSADFTSVIVGGPCKGLTGDTSVLINDKEFVVESIELTRDAAFPVGSILTAKDNLLYPAPSKALLMNAPVAPGSVTVGYRKLIHMRGGEQKHSPRYAYLNSPLNFTRTRPIISHGFIIAGEFYTSACSPLSWARNDSQSRLDDIPVPTIVPILDLHNFLSVGIDCARNKQLVVLLRGEVYTDSRFAFPQSTFQAFRIQVALPDVNTPIADWIEITVGTTGTVRTVLPQRIPRQGQNAALWLGREQVQRRVIYGARGWMVRNVEVASLEFVPCTQFGDATVCASYTNCQWVKNTGCRPTATGTTNQNSATNVPTLGSFVPTGSPTNVPTVFGFKTASPTSNSPTASKAPTFGEYEDTPSPTSKAPTNAPSFPPGFTLSPSQMPTWSPWTWGGGEYEYEYENEYETKSPSAPLGTLRPTARPVNPGSPTSTSRPTTLSPSLVNAPTSRAPSKSPSFFVPTETPDLGNAPSRSPTTEVIVIRVPTTSQPTAAPILVGSESNGSVASGGSGSAAGIGVGTTVAVLALGGIAFFMYRRRNHRSGAVPPGAPAESNGSGAKDQGLADKKAAESMDMEFDVL